MQERLRTARENHVVRKQLNTLENLPATDLLDLDRSVYQHSQRRHERIAARLGAKHVSLPDFQSQVQDRGQSCRQSRVTLKAHCKSFAKEAIQVRAVETRRLMLQRAFS